MNVIIVGGGLSGICLAHEFEKHKVTFRIIDKGVNHSTSVAAGIINPMTFQRLAKTWRDDELIPFLQKFYPEIEKKIGLRFFYPMKLRRIFASENEKALWIEKSDFYSYKKYLSPVESSETTPNYIKNEYGNAFVEIPGYIDSEIFLKHNLSYFENKNNLKYTTFNFDELDVENKTYKGKNFSHLIFAEGFQGENNPFFNYLPFKNAKGDILTIKSDELKNDEIINRKCFILPTNKGNFKIGSTYAWGIKNPNPTEEGKQELLAYYKNLCNAKIKITKHEAGIRPVAVDRRPMLGEHPRHKGIYIFNGLGAKGFMIAPFFAQQMVNFLLGEGKLDETVNIKRFSKKYF